MIQRHLLPILVLSLPVPAAAIPTSAALSTRASFVQASGQSADEQYRFLAGLVEKGMHELAVKEAQAFLRDYPQHAKANLARYRLAGALWELGRRDEAAREYDTLGRIEGFEYRAESLFRSGEGALARGDEARAKAAFEAVLKAGQDYLVAPALFSLGEADFRAKRFDEAEARYQELLRKHPESEQAPLARRGLVWCSFERGDAAATAARARDFLAREKDPALKDEVRLVWAEGLLAGDPKAALEVYRAVETREQSDARARGEGFALAALGDHAGAAAAFERLLAQTPESRYAHEAALQAGIEELRAGNARAAVERLSASAAEGEPETLYWLAQAQKGAGDPRAALATLDQALRRKPASELAGRIQALRGDCLAADGRGDEALAAYEKSGSDQALYAGAVAALNQGDSAGAARLAQRILREDPQGARSQGARVVLAEALFAAKRYDECERACAEAAKQPADAPEAARLASRLAWCRYLAGDLDTAAQRFAELAQRKEALPEVEEALSMQVRIPLERHDPAGAREPAQRYVERYPRGRFLDQALLALARGATGKEARAGYERFLARCPASPLRAGALLELADLESAAGEHEDAAKYYQEVVTAAPESAEAARARYGLAWSAWERGDAAGCEAALSELVGDGARDVPAELREASLELLIWAEIKAGEREQAVASWRRLAACKGDQKRRLDAARTLVTALREADELTTARQVMDECLRTLSDRALIAAGLIETAYLALDSKDFTTAEKAIAVAKKAGAEQAGVAEAGFHLADARFAAGDEEAALALFEDAAKSEHPRTADALYKLGFVHLKRGELEPAGAALGSLLERYPSCELAGEARFLLGECAFRQQRWEDAAGLFGAVRASSAGELRAKALFRSGLALGELGRWSECESTLAELAQLAPQFPNLAEAELWRGRALAAQKKGRAARAAFERTLALDQGELAAQARLGVAGLLESEGRTDDALSEYLKVALLYAHEPSVAEALFRAGRALETLGDPKKAAERYRELVTQHAASPFAREARERLRVLEAP